MSFFVYFNHVNRRNTKLFVYCFPSRVMIEMEEFRFALCMNYVIIKCLLLELVSGFDWVARHPF